MLFFAHHISDSRLWKPSFLGDALPFAERSSLPITTSVNCSHETGLKESVRTKRSCSLAIRRSFAAHPIVLGIDSPLMLVVLSLDEGAAMPLVSPTVSFRDLASLVREKRSGGAEGVGETLRPVILE